MADIFEQKADDEIMKVPPREQTMVAMESAGSRDARLPGERRNPDMAVRNIKRPRFGFDY